eukprot:TRINITY_DN4556_c0_g2_i1.p1 TRINITY_DN4556_c0_g2~~TRINITY_DN4556_c0_g2_i1.p1  ORF type:complete len:105 (+),score=13.58 TRINITY_DN4556_c0_g2_i1:113-427(+)
MMEGGLLPSPTHMHTHAVKGVSASQPANRSKQATRATRSADSGVHAYGCKLLLLLVGAETSCMHAVWVGGTCMVGYFLLRAVKSGQPRSAASVRAILHPLQDVD